MAPLSSQLPATFAPFHNLLSRIKRRILRHSKDRWDYQYASGLWEKLKAPVEHARLEACARLLRRHALGGDVLEIGCGEALLLRHVTPVDYNTWLGIDVSEFAVARAQEFSNSRARFIRADMTTLRPSGDYHAIIFPESIYYAPHPALILQHYAPHLEAGGVFIISIFENGERDRVWQEIHSVAYPIDSCTTRNERGEWICEVLRMRRSIRHTSPADALL